MVPFERLPPGSGAAWRGVDALPPACSLHPLQSLVPRDAGLGCEEPVLPASGNGSFLLFLPGCLSWGSSAEAPLAGTPERLPLWLFWLARLAVPLSDLASEGWASPTVGLWGTF